MSTVRLETAIRQPIRVGATVWRFDANHRIYRKRRKGDDYSVTGSPVWRRYWVRRKITGETSRSWITNLDEKIPKNGPRRGWAFSEDEIADIGWIEDHAWPISERFRRAATDRTLTAEQVREIARIVGYEPKPKTNPEGEAYCPTCDGVGWLDRDEAGRRVECGACEGTGFPL